MAAKKRFFTQKLRKGFPPNLVKVAFAVNKTEAKNYERAIKGKLSSIAKEWRTWARNKLSGACAGRNGGGGALTGYPGMCSGSLEQHLTYRTYSKISRGADTWRVSLGTYREFLKFENKRGFNYADFLNTRHYELRGYKEKIYAELDKRVSGLLKYRDKIIYGTRADLAF